MPKLTVNGNDVDVKFTFGSVYRLNKTVSTKDKDGRNQGDGAVIVWSALTEYSPDAVIVLAQCSTKDHISSEDVADAVSKLSNPLAFIDEILDEGKHSGFFKKTLETYKGKMEKTLELIPTLTIENKDATVSELNHQIQIVNDYLS